MTRAKARALRSDIDRTFAWLEATRRAAIDRLRLADGEDVA